MKFLNNISYTFLIAKAVLMALLPFQSEPHLIEKIKMLLNGTLSRPIDIFDLFWHSLPTVLLMVKLYQDVKQSQPES